MRLDPVATAAFSPDANVTDTRRRMAVLRTTMAVLDHRPFSFVLSPGREVIEKLSTFTEL